MARPTTKDQLLALSALLDTMTEQQLRVAIVDIATRASAADRQKLLGWFEQQVAASQPPEPSVLSDVRSFVQRAGNGEFDSGTYDDWDSRYGSYRDRRDYWHDDDYYDSYDEPDTEWTYEFEALASEADLVFRSGDLETARMAYGPLLAVLTGDNWGERVEPMSAVDVDLSTMLSRHLRAVYEVTDLEHRAAALLTEIETLDDLVPTDTVSLAAIIKARRNKLRDLDDFLPRWIDALRSNAIVPFQSTADELLIEAAAMQSGADGLRDLAETDGQRNTDFWLAWVEKLAADGRTDDAISAMHEALEQLTDTATQAAVCDRVASTVQATGPSGAAELRIMAFEISPSYARLCLVAEATSADRLDEALATQANRLTLAGSGPAGAGDPRHTDVLLTVALLLATGQGDRATWLVESAGASIGAGANVGWDGWQQHSSPLIVPYLLASSCPRWPPARKKLLLSKRLEHLQTSLRAPTGAPLDVWRSPFTRDRVPDDIGGRAKAGAAVIASRVMSGLSEDAASLSPASRKLRLTSACLAVDEELHAIVSGQQRGRYADGARWLVAAAEAFACGGNEGAGRQLVDDVRARYPRHTAFHEALGEAMRTSPMF
ncbi:MAG: hypothetical protein HYX32_07795 [Actinobacteria bacterium]|nr:hypothetical protein [Actinomycetota bacterium]